MKFFLLSDKIDTLTGMKLAGVNGVFVDNKDDLLNQLNKICLDKEVGIIIITERLSFMIPEQLHTLRTSKNKPIITIIPDRHGSLRDKDYITNYIKESIGISI